LRAKKTAEFGPLKLLPLLDARWEHEETLRNPTAFAGDKSLGSCPAAVELVRRTPELLTATNWLALEQLCWRSRADKEIPDASLWFSHGPPQGTNYDAHRRIAQILNLDALAVEQALARSPHDAVLVRWRVGWQEV